MSFQVGSAVRLNTIRATAVVAPITQPTLVRHYTFASALGNQSTTRNWPIWPVLPGNSLVVKVMCNNARTPTVGDDKTGTYTIDVNFNGTTFGERLCIVRRFNINDAPTNVTVTWAGGLTNNFLSGEIEEWCGLLDNGFDTGTGAQGTSSSPAPGSITTATDNELVVSVVGQMVGQTFVSLTKGSGNTLLAADIVDGLGVQYQVKATAGSVNPGFTFDASYGWICAQAAYKFAAVGTRRPSGVQRIARHHQQIRAKTNTAGDYTAGNYFCQFPCGEGSKLHAEYIGSMDIGTITDTQGNTWTPTGNMLAISGGSGGMRNYYCDGTLAETLTLTLPLTGAGAAPGHTIQLIETSGLAAGLAVHAETTGTNTTTNDVTGVSITPAVANGLVFNTFGEQDETALSIDIGQFDTSTDRPTSPSPWPNDENNGWSSYQNPNTSAFAGTWHSDGPPGGWGSIADAFSPS